MKAFHHLALCLVALIFMLGTLPVAANTALRQWKNSDGKAFQALITHWDSETDLVTLTDDDAKSFTIKRTELSLPDQAYVRQWHNNREKLTEKLKALGGEMQFLQTSGQYKIDYYVYKPSSYRADGTEPMMILFSPSALGYNMMLRHVEAAEKTGFVLVTADYFRNNIDRKIGTPRFAAFLPQVQTISHDPKKLFMGGSSGGALRAYYYSSKFDLPWAGIYANGGWLGHDYKMPCRKNMRVAMINGHKDRAALGYTKRDTDYLADQRDCNVALFSFEGGHQLAPTESQIEAFNWLLGKER